MAKLKYLKQNKIIIDIVNKRFNIFIIIILLFTLIFFIRLFNIQLLNHNYYNEAMNSKAVTTTTSNSTPRGRIYDRNGKLLVDNKAVKVIKYQKQEDLTTGDEINLAYEVANVLTIDYTKLNTKELKTFWLIKNKEKASNLITKEEYQKLDERKLTTKDLEQLKMDRVPLNELNKYNNLDKEAAYIYYLMNKGYSYQEKIIKDVNVTDYEYAYLTENKDNLKGFSTNLEWERTYLYGDTLKSILGKVSSSTTGIPSELKEYYLALGYDLNDRVGISGIEYQYESYLKGDKATYNITDSNEYELIKKGTRGHDIYLTIDIDLQLQIESILKEEILVAKTDPNSIFYNHSFVIVSKPKTGEILAMASKQVLLENNQYNIYDYTSAIITSPVTVGSVIKGASLSTGYKYKAIDIGTKFLDQCIKIKNTPEKCSYRDGLGLLDDVNALKWSSNSYQFQTTIKVANGNYAYNQILKIDPDAFNKYRNMYHSYGLGVKTGIDLPNESIGYKGISTMPGLLLDFSIGQYDTYTPMQVSQYINTIANKGYRITPHLLKSVYDNEKLLYNYEPKLLNRVDLDYKYSNRIIEGFRAVMEGPLGSSYMGSIPNAGGKTGTAQSFLDTNNDGNIDQETITNTFGGFYPYTNPEISIVVISPDVLDGDTDQISRINRKITSRISNTTYNRYKY